MEGDVPVAVEIRRDIAQYLLRRSAVKGSGHAPRAELGRHCRETGRGLEAMADF